jgi:hypothetical protein
VFQKAVVIFESAKKLAHPQPFQFKMEVSNESTRRMVRSCHHRRGICNTGQRCSLNHVLQSFTLFVGLCFIAYSLIFQPNDQNSEFPNVLQPTPRPATADPIKSIVVDGLTIPLQMEATESATLIANDGSTIPLGQTVTAPTADKLNGNSRSSCESSVELQRLYKSLDENNERDCGVIAGNSEKMQSLARNCMNRAGCIVFQIRNGALYGFASRKQFQSRHLAVMKLVNASLYDDIDRERSIYRGHQLRDVTFSVVVLDEAERLLRRNFPVMVFDRGTRMRRGFAVPDFTFYSWPEANMRDVVIDVEESLRRIGTIPFQLRTNFKIIWRGAAMRPKLRMNVVNGTDNRAKKHRHLRTGIVQLNETLNQYNLSDIQYVTYPLPECPHAMTLTEMCRNRRYLLHTEGLESFYSSRLKWLLMCGGVVFIPELHYHEYWTLSLVDRQTHVTISNDPFVAAMQIVDFIRNTSEEEQSRIAANGRALAYQIATRQAAKCVWYRTISSISNCANGTTLQTNSSWMTAKVLPIDVLINQTVTRLSNIEMP